jgi:hypothetical protein
MILFGPGLKRTLPLAVLIFAGVVVNPVLHAQDFTGTWSLWANGFKGEFHLKQTGSQIRGWASASGLDDEYTGSVNGREIRFTRNNRSLAQPQEYRGFAPPPGEPVDHNAMAGLFSHLGKWDYGWYAVRTGAYFDRPGGAVSSGAAIVGTWNWVSGQTLQINADGSVRVYQGSSQINQGRWANLSGRQYRFWHNSGGYIDTVMLSEDGNALDGSNHLGYRLHGTRQGQATSISSVKVLPTLAGTWNWVSGQTLVISGDSTFEVWQGGRKINDGRWVNLGGQRYRLTHRSGGWVDTVTLSNDSMSLDGVNNVGNRVQGRRRGS